MKSYTETFEQGRKCEHCGTPIADQEHKLRTHCRPLVLEDGTVISCKDDKNAERRKEADEQYRKLVALHKRLFNALEDLLSAYGNFVTVEQLNRFGVQLDKAVSLQRKEGLLIFSFLHHKLEQQINQTFTIKREQYAL